MTANLARERFVALIQQDDAAIDLAEACLWISAEANPALDVESYRSRLRGLADVVRPKLHASASLHERVALLAKHLYGEEKFRGNRSEFYDPRNSYLDCVLDRRTGIPITLSILWMAVAKRLDIPAYGVGFPGHFLVGIKRNTRNDLRIYVDPFSGTVLTPENCRERLHELTGHDVRFDSGWLAATSHREILARVLRNLKQIHIQAKDLRAAVACIDRILFLEPDHPGELCDRGLIYRSLECWTSAREDLERFVALAPEAEEVENVRRILEELYVRTARIH